MTKLSAFCLMLSLILIQLVVIKLINVNISLILICIHLASFAFFAVLFFYQIHLLTRILFPVGGVLNVHF